MLEFSWKVISMEFLRRIFGRYMAGIVVVVIVMTAVNLIASITEALAHRLQAYSRP